MNRMDLDHFNGCERKEIILLEIGSDLGSYQLKPNVDVFPLAVLSEVDRVFICNYDD